MTFRILMTLDAVGGVWRYAMDLARALGTDVVFLGFGPPPGPDQRAEAERLGILDWTNLPLDWMVADPADLSGVPGAVAEAAARHGADLIHLNLPSQAAGLRTDLPVLAVSHSCVTTWFRAVKGADLPLDWRWQRDLNAAGLARADTVVAPSRAYADLMRRVYGIGAEVVHNAVAAVPDRTADRPMVVASGRWWDDGKNGAVLDHAAPRMDWPVTLIGPLGAATGQCFTPRHATSVGALAHDEAIAIMRNAGIFVSPSLYEPFGLAVAEAAVAAVPLVLADIPTFRELWDGAARFFDPADPDALARIVNELSRDTDARRQLGQAALLRSQGLSPRMQADTMLTLYARLTEPQPRTATR